MSRACPREQDACRDRVIGHYATGGFVGKTGMRGEGKAIAACGVRLGAAAAVAALVCGAALADDAAPAPPLPPLPGVTATARLEVATVSFANRHLAPVRIVRGPRQPPPVPGRPIVKQVVNFRGAGAARVTVIRGAVAIPASLRDTLVPGATRIETVSFIDPELPAVTVMRGSSGRDWFALDLFGAPNAGDLDRIAFAVDGVESRHGADLRMWRPSLTGPQGPMQVSLAAALDVGGGDRFDLLQNRLLGRAYLAQMYARYGNWPDAVAAYNWGPGSMDQWIAGGRRPDRLPLGVAVYVDRVLRDAAGKKAARR